MNCYIALLRGINVSGQKKILMADLRRLLESLGFEGVQTYIQSGNVVFSFDGTAAVAQEQISNAIESNFGWKVPILVKKASELVEIIQNCPFSEEKCEKSYFTLLHDFPSEERVIEVNELSYKDEEFAIRPNCVYFFSVAGYGRAKMNNSFFEKKLQVTATTRNYRTMVKLIEMTS